MENHFRQWYKNKYNKEFRDRESLKKLDSDFLKDFVCGEIKNTIMYGTSELKKIQCKLNIISNNNPNFRTDAGILRRGIMEILTNEFIDEEKYHERKNEPNVYLINRDLEEKFNTDKYKLAFINLLIPYAFSFCNKKYFKIPQQLSDPFKEICNENDKMQQFLDSHFIITKNERDRIHKDYFTKLFNDHFNTNYEWKFLMSDIKRLINLGIRYEKNYHHNGKQGVILCIKPK